MYEWVSRICNEGISGCVLWAWGEYGDIFMIMYFNILLSLVAELTLNTGNNTQIKMQSSDVFLLLNTPAPLS